MMDAAARCLCDARGERPRVTRSGYLYYAMQPGCPEHDARQTIDYDEPGHRNPYEGTTP